jgi:hypothetical protein
MWRTARVDRREHMLAEAIPVQLGRTASVALVRAARLGRGCSSLAASRRLLSEGLQPQRPPVHQLHPHHSRQATGRIDTAPLAVGPTRCCRRRDED